MGEYIQFDKVVKNYGSIKVIDGLDLAISRGEFVSLLGPSGSGKTTMLMMLAGFEDTSGGKITVDGHRVDNLPAHDRNMGVVFQNYALFPHMTIAENIAFPLKMRKMPSKEIKARVDRALEMVQLGQVKDRKPSQLSGGQQQRIALARALVFEPQVVLMDEPLGALDKQLREHMQLELRELHKKLGLTIVFVTHDQNEAITMSDRIAVFNKGKIEQIDSPEEIYLRPKTRFVAEFVGETNLLEGQVVGASAGTVTVKLSNGAQVKCATSARLTNGTNVFVSVRPESLSLTATDTHVNVLEAVVDDLVFQGDHTRVHLRSKNLKIAMRLAASKTDLKIGQNISVSFAPEICSVVV